MGTLGPGNHYIEIQSINEKHDSLAAKKMGINKLNQVCVMIHSGSRGLGHQTCDETLHKLSRTFQQYGPDYAALPDRQLACAPLSSPVGKQYLAAMQAAANFAWANRQVMTGLAIEAIAGALDVDRQHLKARLLYDVCHNIAKVERHKRRVSTGAFDLIVDLFQAAHCAGDEDDMRAFAREPAGDGRADPS